MWIPFNENPAGHRVGDCTIRAISLALDVSWDTAYRLLVEKGWELKDMPSANVVWASVLRSHGFFRRVISNACPDCYSVADFARDHPQGVYVLKTQDHVLTVISGDWLDSWNSADEPVEYYFYREE